jgi:hypothetical protein
MRLQLGGESRVNEAQINPLLNCEQLLWNSDETKRHALAAMRSR